jgi:hypothetical protein
VRNVGQSFAFVLFFLQPSEKLLSLGGVPQEEGGRCGQGPLEGRIADFFARGAHAFTA